MNRRHFLTGLSVLAACVAVTPLAAQTKPAAPGPTEDHPFAEHFLALQLSDSDPGKARLALSVASNILKFYGPDKVAIEVVTFGPGIDLLKVDNEHRALVDSLVSQGVRFSVCGNTLDTIERDTGQRPKINPHAHEVEAGVAQLLALTESGYTVVRP